MKNTTANINTVIKVARALGQLNKNVVFVGGATVSLYVDDPAAEDVRPTKDIDVFLEISSLVQLEELRIELKKRGFKQSHKDDIICRFRYDDIKVDVMSTNEIGWAPGNKFFSLGLNNLVKVELEDISINILSLPYFIASKFAAFQGRGGNDPRLSHDFEDIVYICDNRINFVESILDSDKETLFYLNSWFKKILNNTEFKEAILTNLYYETQIERADKIFDKMKLVIETSKH